MPLTELDMCWKQKKIYHNDWMLHTPFPYLSPSILCHTFSKECLSCITLWSTMSLSCTWLHVLSDSLWPIRLAATDKKITVVIPLGLETFSLIDRCLVIKTETGGTFHWAEMRPTLMSVPTVSSIWLYYNFFWFQHKHNIKKWFKYCYLLPNKILRFSSTVTGPVKTTNRQWGSGKRKTRTIIRGSHIWRSCKLYQEREM